MIKYNLTILVLVLILSSCEKVVNIDLKNAESMLVIEGKIDNSGNPAKVTISKTVPFSNDNLYPTVTGAKVTVTDNLGNTYIFSEQSSGIYTNASLVGTSGTKYSLKVELNNNVYTSSSTMPMPVIIDSIKQDKITLSEPIIFVRAFFKDAPGFGSKYQLVEKVNGKQNKIPFLFDDIYLDGGIVPYELIDQDAKIKVGDTVNVEIRAIDDNIYKYLRGLQDNTIGGTVPANPESNITGGVFGFFSAQTSFKKQVIIK